MLFLKKILSIYTNYANENHSSNPRLLSKQTRKIPLGYLCLIVILYVCYGFFNRDPWKNEDVIGFSSIYTLLNKPLLQWGQIIYNIPDKNGQIYYIFSAFIAKILVLFDVRIEHSIRIGTILLLLATIYFIWKTAFKLACHKSFTPYEYPLGGQPSIHNYAYTIANISILMYCSSIGAILRIHETTPFIMGMFIFTLLIYGLISNYIYCLLAILILYTFGHSLLLNLTILWIIYVFIDKYLVYLNLKNDTTNINTNTNTKIKHYLYKYTKYLSIIILILYLVTNLYIYQELPTWESISIKNRLDMLITQYPTFTWPLLPFSIYTYFIWHKNSIIRYFLLFNLYIIGLFIFDKVIHQAYFLYIIPTLCILCALAFTKLSISLQKSIVGFSIFGFTALLVILWLIWGAWQLNYSFITQLAYVNNEFNFKTILFALIFSILWFYSIYIQRKILLDPPLWLSAYFMAIGLSCSWIVIVHLWLPAVNQIKTYRYVFNTINNYIGKECTNIYGLQAPQLASLVYMSTFKIGNKCQFLITYIPYKNDLNPAPPLNYRLIWQGHRLLDKDEMFYLWKFEDKTKMEM